MASRPSAAPARSATAPNRTGPLVNRAVVVGNEGAPVTAEEETEVVVAPTLAALFAGLALVLLRVRMRRTAGAS